VINEDNADKRAKSGNPLSKGVDQDPNAHLQNLFLYKLGRNEQNIRMHHLKYEHVAHNILAIPRVRWANQNSFRNEPYKDSSKRKELEDGLATFMAEKYTSVNGEMEPYDQQRVYACVHILAKFTMADTSKILNVCNIIRTMATKTEVDAIRKYLNRKMYDIIGIQPLSGKDKFKFDNEQDPEALGQTTYDDDENEAADPSWFSPGSVFVLLIAIVLCAGGVFQLKKLGYLSCIGLKGDQEEDPEVVERDLTAIRRSIRQSERRASVARGRGGKSLKKSLFDFMPKPRASSRATASSVSSATKPNNKKLKEPLNPGGYRDLEMASSNAGSHARTASKDGGAGSRSARSRERTDRRMGGGQV